MGEVNARSCVIIGPFGVIARLRYAASWVVQRDVHGVVCLPACRRAWQAQAATIVAAA
jgi:hypothetical protein